MEALALAIMLYGEPSALPQSRPQQMAETCFPAGEQASGNNKICYYQCLGGTVAINIPVLQFCPLSINN